MVEQYQEKETWKMVWYPTPARCGGSCINGAIENIKAYREAARSEKNLSRLHDISEALKRTKKESCERCPKVSLLIKELLGKKLKVKFF
ncbi:MAG: hypothetical protein ABIB79_05575 [archaeon]